MAWSRIQELFFMGDYILDFFKTIEKLFLLKWLKKGPKFIGHIYTSYYSYCRLSIFFEFESSVFSYAWIHRNNVWVW